MGSLINNETRMNLKDERTYELLNQKFKEALEKDLMEYIDFNVDNNVDLLGIAKYNYIQNRVKTSTPWNNKKIIINLDFSLAKKGIIYDSIKA